jgi:thiamine-phosphate diphosphorylase
VSTGAAVVASVPVVHAVTSDEIIAEPDFLGRARRVMRALGPRGAIQLRAARASGARLYALAVLLEEARRESGCAVVVNDRLDVALAARSWGAQLTSRSLGVADARRIAPALPIGASAHDAAEAGRAAREGATWIVAGRPGSGRDVTGDAPGRGLAAIRGIVAAAAAVPVIAIGGVRPDDLPALRAAGAHGAAAIRGIWDAENAELAASAYLSSHDGHG